MAPNCVRHRSGDAATYGVPAILVSGALRADALKLTQHNIGALLSIAPGPISLEEAMTNAAGLLERATAQALRLVAIDRRMHRV